MASTAAGNETARNRPMETLADEQLATIKSGTCDTRRPVVKKRTTQVFDAEEVEKKRKRVPCIKYRSKKYTDNRTG